MKQDILVEDLDAGYYVRHSSLQNGLANEILSNYPIKRTAHILDVGCGDGRITAELADLASKGRVIGLDPSPSMIEFARNTFPKTEFPNLDFQLGMAEDAVFTETFDLITSFSCFHWLKEPQKAFHLLSSLLKKGGEMLILTYPKESPYYRYLQIALKKYPEYYPLSANHSMLSASEYKKILPQNHLEITDFRKKNLIAYYNTPEEIRQYIRGWLNSYVPLPEYLYDSFLEEVSQAMLADPTTSKKGRIGIPYTALVIEAKK